MPWTTIARIAFSVMITAVGKIQPAQWAHLGTFIADALQKMSDRLPAGHPFVAAMSAYRAPASKLRRPGDAH